MENRKDLEQTVENIKAELEEVAKELGLPVENSKILLEWGKRGGWYNDEIAEKLILPLYLTSPCYAIKTNEQGETIAVKWTQDSEWDYSKNIPSSHSKS